MRAKLPYRDWIPISFGDILVGHLLYFENVEDGSYNCIIRSHGAFFRLPTEIESVVKAHKPADGALVAIEYRSDGYDLSVLCEYRNAAKKEDRLKHNQEQERTLAEQERDEK